MYLTATSSLVCLSLISLAIPKFPDPMSFTSSYLSLSCIIGRSMAGPTVTAARSMPQSAHIHLLPPRPIDQILPQRFQHQIPPPILARRGPSEWPERDSQRTEPSRRPRDRESPVPVLDRSLWSQQKPIAFRIALPVPRGSRDRGRRCPLWWLELPRDVRFCFRLSCDREPQINPVPSQVRS